MDNESNRAAADPQQVLPAGLADVIEAFSAAVDAKNKRLSPVVRERIIERFSEAFGRHQRDWRGAGSQVLTVAGLAGRLAALYAELDGALEVQWLHARFGLRDAQAECQADVTLRGKHCENVDLELPLGGPRSVGNGTFPRIRTRKRTGGDSDTPERAR